LVNFKTEGELSSSLSTSNTNGIATVSWTPKDENDYLTAEIVDENGTAISSVTLEPKIESKPEEDVLELIPDPAFLAYCRSQMPYWDTNSNGKLSFAEAAAVTRILFGWWGEIASLEGIEYFTGLIELSCNYNQLTSLDVSKNTALTDLSCYGNQLTSLDVSKNTALTHLACFVNQLTSLDISKNTALEWLDCGSNQLTTLDV
jgi:hypothetical protein